MSQKLELLKAEAEDAKWKKNSALSEKVIMARRKIEELQRLVQQDPGSTDLLACESCAVKYYSKMRAKEHLLKQKARAQ